jgi:hypothetical protein
MDKVSTIRRPDKPDYFQRAILQADNRRQFAGKPLAVWWWSSPSSELVIKSKEKIFIACAMA